MVMQNTAVDVVPGRDIYNLGLLIGQLTGYYDESPERVAWEQGVTQYVDTLLDEISSGKWGTTPRHVYNALAYQGLVPAGVGPEAFYNTYTVKLPAMRAAILNQALGAATGTPPAPIVQRFGRPPARQPTLEREQFEFQAASEIARQLANPVNILAAPYLARLGGVTVGNDFFFNLRPVQRVLAGIPRAAQQGRVIASGDILPNITSSTLSRQALGALSPAERTMVTKLGAGNEQVFDEDFIQAVSRKLIPGSVSGTTVYG